MHGPKLLLSDSEPQLPTIRTPAQMAARSRVHSNTHLRTNERTAAMLTDRQLSRSTRPATAFFHCQNASSQNSTAKTAAIWQQPSIFQQLARRKQPEPEAGHTRARCGPQAGRTRAASEPHPVQTFARTAQLPTYRRRAPERPERLLWPSFDIQILSFVIPATAGGPYIAERKTFR